MGLVDGVLVAFLLLRSGLPVNAESHGSYWAYWGDYGPQHWPGVCQTGKRQSPIDIVTYDAIRADLDALEFVRYDYAFPGTVTNTEHTIQIELTGVPILLRGGSLPSTYILEQMHFHWPAEHTIDGVRHPLELHLVHRDKQYDNVSVAAQHENGIAVVAVLFQLSNDDNTDLNPIVRATASVWAWVGKSTTDIRMKIVPSLLLPKDHTTYYRYEGSLTTPACQQSVMWFVLTEKLTVSDSQVEFFRNVGTRNGTLKYNYRPIQNLNARKVYHHLSGYSGTATSISADLCYSFFSVILVSLLRSAGDQ